MSISNAGESDINSNIFLASGFSWAGNSDLYVSLHTADPGEAGNQTTSETSYGSYARVAVARTPSGWTVSSGAVSNAALIQFPQCSSGTATITHVGIGTAASSTGRLLISGELSSPLAVSSGIQPQFAAGDLDFTLD